MNDAPLKKPLDWDDLYPGRYLKAGQLGDRRPTLTIKSVNLEKLQDDKGADKTKGVLSFVEIPYELALNKTNGLCLREMLGRNLERWPGRKITLYRGEVESGSQRGEPAVRVWGSPELTEDRTVEIRLPRKRPLKMVLHAVRASEPARVDRHPTEGRRNTQAAASGTTAPGPVVPQNAEKIASGTTRSSLAESADSSAAAATGPDPDGGNRPPFG